MEGGRRDATHAEAPVDLRRGARAGGHRWAQRKAQPASRGAATRAEAPVDLEGWEEDGWKEDGRKEDGWKEEGGMPHTPKRPWT